MCHGVFAWKWLEIKRGVSVKVLIRVSCGVIDFEIVDLLLYRAVTDKELLNIYRKEDIDLVIVEYTQGMSLECLKAIEKEKIILVAKEEIKEQVEYKVCESVEVLEDYLKGLVVKENVVEEYEKAIEKLNGEVEELRACIKEGEDTEESIKRSEESQKQLQATIRAMETDKEALSNKVKALEGELEVLQNSTMLYDVEISEYKYTIESREQEVEEVKGQLEEVKAYIRSLIVKYKGLSEEESNPLEVKEIEKVIEEITNEKAIIFEELKNANKLSDEHSNLEQEQLVKIAELSQKVLQYELEVKENESKLEHLKNAKDIEIFNLTQERDNLKKKTEWSEQEMNVLRDLNKQTNDRLLETQKKLSEVGNYQEEMGRYQLRIKGLEESEESLNLRMQESLREKMQMTQLLREKESEIERLNDDLAYEKSRKGTSTKVVVRNMIKHYTGRAKVIPIFGTGSYGITSLTVSLADVLKGSRVLVMDFDLIAPRMDAYYRINPTCELTDIKQSEMRTSVGALMYKGSDYVCKHLNKAIKPIQNNLHYFSGIYYGVNESRFMSINFELLMNTLGEHYDYILVDCGKLGCSYYTDTLIKTMHSISYRSIIVSLNDIFDTRSAFLRLNNAGISMDNHVWVLNMSRKSMVDKDSLRYCTALKQIIFTRENIYGEYKLYDRVANLRGKLAELKKIVE